jgi:hypothetical protein
MFCWQNWHSTYYKHWIHRMNTHTCTFFAHYIVTTCFAHYIVTTCNMHSLNQYQQFPYVKTCFIAVQPFHFLQNFSHAFHSHILLSKYNWNEVIMSLYSSDPVNHFFFKLFSVIAYALILRLHDYWYALLLINNLERGLLRF